MFLLLTAVLACLSTMPRQKNVYQALKWPGMKRLLLTHPCAPAKSARNNSYLVLIQIQVVVSIVYPLQLLHFNL